MNRRRFLATASAAVPLVAGCIGAPGANAQSRFPGYEWDRLDRADAIPSPEVVMRGRAFLPLVAAVSPGTEVTFTNLDPEPHTVTIPVLDVDVTVDGDDETTVAFEEEGRFDYVCTFHPPDMLGRMFVTDAPLRR